jgi:uncharacterized protein YcbK (DUF882 family)
MFNLFEQGESRLISRCLPGLFAILISAVPTLAESLPDEARLKLYNTHTRQHIEVTYRHGSEYIPEALSTLDVFLRDPLNGDVHHFDPHLFDVLFDLTRTTGHPDAEIDIICGYRSPQTNEYLRTHTSGVAKHSLHMEAEAIDIRLPGVKTSQLRDAALALGRGGVGYYASSDFIHVDVGRVRRW